MSEETVQGDTESGSDSGVYSDPATPAVDPVVESAPIGDAAVDAGIQEAVKAPETPAAVEYKFEMPEGVEADQKALDMFIPIAQELGLTQEAAQKIVSIQANMQKEAMDLQKTSVDNARNDWVKQITEDPELGGEKLQETIHIANKGLKSVATEGFMKLLEQTGLGDHPEVIKVFHAIGKNGADDSLVLGGPISGGGTGIGYANSPELK